METSAVKTKYLKDYKEFDYQIDQLDLTIELYEEHAIVTARLEVKVKDSGWVQRPPFICDGLDLELISIDLDRSRLEKSDYQLDEKSLTLTSPPESFELITKVKVYPDSNDSLEGLYRSNDMFCTQCEAEGFRRITFFPDRPDVMTYFNTTIMANKDQYPILLSNGNLIKRGDLAENRHWVEWEDPFKKPSYLFAVVAGDLKWIEEDFKTCSGRSVKLQIFVEPENIDRCDHAMSSLKKAMRWDEKQFGREYDLDIYMIVAVNDFNAGAMENKGLNIFNAVYVLARPDTATDLMYERIEGVIGHEYFHNWTGNRITCRDWFQLSLKEGLTVFRDQQFTSDMTSKTVKRIRDVDALRTIQFAEDAGGMAHPVRPGSYIEIDNFYTVTIYEKGAEVIRMLHTLLGEKSFKKALGIYFERHDGQAVTTEDFVQVMEDSSKRDLKQFRRWYYQAGTPEVTVKGVYDKTERKFSLSLQQQTPATPGQKNKDPFHIPLSMGLLGRGGDPLVLKSDGQNLGTETVLNFTKNSENFDFEDIKEKPVLSIHRGFSAPIKLLLERSDEELSFLIANDVDLFGRWNAAQELSIRVILARVDSRSNAKTDRSANQIIEAFRAVLLDKKLDRRFVASLLNLPGEIYLADQMKVIDIEGIFHVREELKKEIASSLQAEFLEIYRENVLSTPYQYCSRDVSKRDLKNTVIHYLTSLKSEGMIHLCRSAYNDSNNMTDELAALSCLSNIDYPEREKDLDQFQKRWFDDPLVMDLWFGILGRSIFTKVDHIRKWMGHPKFDKKNPNRIRALIGNFSAGNMVNFHQIDGDGYTFLADQVLRLDRFNPLLAARMMSPFNRWRKLDTKRKEASRKQLEKILNQPELSPNTYEIASKLLPEK